MEHFTYEGSNQKVIEKFMMVIYSIYGTIMIVASVEYQWDRWISLILVVGLAVSWIVNIGRLKSYRFRARFTAIMMQLSLILYAINLDEINSILPILATFIVLAGVYGMPEIVNMSVLTVIIIFFYQGVIAGNIPNETVSDTVVVWVQIGNMLFLEYVVYVWTKRNSEGSKTLLGVIEELKEVESMKDDFMANVSHEIRTPINTICGISEVVLQDDVTHKVKQRLLDIQQAGRTLMAVVSDMLDFSELQSGKMELEEEAYNITSTINDVINMSMARKNEKKLELIVDCNANMPCALLGDEKKIRRVIMKLVDNAIKFTTEGCVSINIDYRKENYGINLVVTIKDTGIGMDEESLERLFTKFSQVDTSRKRQEGGIGIGLAISYALIKKMGGVITVKSKLGKGSVVKFVVPQKVLDETPIASINDRGNINVATYIDMEQFDIVEIRDEYSKSIVHMVEELKIKCHVCRNFSELQRRVEKEEITHIFTSIIEYRQEMEYFDEIANRTKVIVVMNRGDDKYVNNPQILIIYKPFYILTIVSVLNGLNDTRGENYQISSGKFETEDVHVLVVDDNRMNIRVIEGFLEEYKIKVTTAISGQEALDKIDSANYDFVFMDHMMPEMDGVETMHRIRHKVGSYFQKVPIIALTANTIAGTREMMLEEGFSDFLEKPIERSVLERVLKRNLAPEKIVAKNEHNSHTYAQEESENNTIDNDVAEVNVNEMTGEKKTGEVPSVTELEKLLAPKGLDVQTGILYCNGKERYIDILKGYCEECDDSGMLADQLFEKGDWKNYVIAVHGMKSAMRSIGAIRISESARKLEFAGKEGRMGYIMDNHNKLMEEYRELFLGLKEYDWICDAGKAEKKQESQKTEEINAILLNLEDTIFNEMIADMEEAMYALDGERLSEIISELEKYKYCEKPLKKLLVPVKRKVEMSDYISAVEMVVRLKNSMARGGN